MLAFAQARTKVSSDGALPFVLPSLLYCCISKQSRQVNTDLQWPMGGFLPAHSSTSALASYVHDTDITAMIHNADRTETPSLQHCQVALS